MAPIIKSSMPDRQLALDWAQQFLNVKACQRVSNRPWAKTYKISHDDGQAYLKILAPVLAPAATTSPEMAERFPGTIPPVVGADREKGLILTAEHGGRDLEREPGEKSRSRLLATYAGIQAQCANDAELLQRVEKKDLPSMLDDLILFLSPEQKPERLGGAQVSADYFMSSSRARKYAKLFTKRAALLRSYIERSAKLPDTINHCDLRPSNAAKNHSGSPIIYDWDDALTGPAGMSLHAMFSGCTTLLQVLHRKSTLTDPEKLRQTRREVDVYLDALADAGYADKSSLLENIGGAAVAGMIFYIISYSRYPKDSRSYRRTIQRNIKKRLSSLLDVCDFLCLEESDNVSDYIEDYLNNSKPWRAERLLRLQLESRPFDTKSLATLGILQRERGRVDRSIRTFHKSLHVNPSDADVLTELGIAYNQTGKYDRAIACLQQSLDIQDSKSARSHLKRASELRQYEAEAEKPGTVPTIEFSEQEKKTSQYSPETLKLCDSLFRRYGTLLMKNVFDKELLQECHDKFVDEYRSYMSDSRHKDALRIGDKRFQITLEMKPPFNTPELYGNDLILPLMRKLVGMDCILGCFVSVMSLPGSESQRLHKDHKDLFYDDPESTRLPSFAVTVMVPMVDLNESVGTTRIIKGSHRKTTAQTKGMPMQTPFVNVGDCYLMDYRLSHHGQANTSDTPRPIVSMLYQRPWFRDYMNFKKQPPIRMNQEDFDKVQESLQPLLKWTTLPLHR